MKALFPKACGWHGFYVYLRSHGIKTHLLKAQNTFFYVLLRQSPDTFHHIVQVNQALKLDLLEVCFFIRQWWISGGTFIFLRRVEDSLHFQRHTPILHSTVPVPIFRDCQGLCSQTRLAGHNEIHWRHSWLRSLN